MFRLIFDSVPRGNRLRPSDPVRGDPGGLFAFASLLSSVQLPLRNPPFSEGRGQPDSALLHRLWRYRIIYRRGEMRVPARCGSRSGA